MATLATMVASGLVVGSTFLIGGQLVQESEHLIKEGYNYIKYEFANKRKNKDGNNPLTNHDNINDKVTANERKILMELIGKKK